MINSVVYSRYGGEARRRLKRLQIGIKNEGIKGLNISKVGRTRITSWSWVSEKAGRIGSHNKEERIILMVVQFRL